MNTYPPHVSIGLPVYNGERFLEEAIESILVQTYQDFELVISDNSSTDKTPAICQAYAAKDERIRYHQNSHNLGAAKNQNRVVELSRGKYFKWAHHDDLCAPVLLEKCVEILDNYPAVVLCYPKTMILNEKGEQLEEYNDNFNLRSHKPHQRFKHYHQLVRHGNKCNPLHGLIRTDKLKSTSLIGSYPSSDLVLLGQLVLQGEFFEVPEYLFFKREHPNTSVKAYPTYRERIAWYDPTKKGKLQLTKWKWFFEYLKSIERNSMSRFEKIYCYRQMATWCAWNWVWLVKDLIKAVTWPFIKPFLNFEASRVEKLQLPG
ncbi:MAG: glycosyltransferase family 2 protein [Cyanophyceae cyanobacterium]